MLPETVPPGWEFLLSHHTAERYDRTLAVPVRTRTVHFCARCTGQLVGFVALLTPWLVIPRVAAATLDPLVLVGLALLPAPAALDWYLQAAHHRESTNGRRIATGAGLGAAFGALVALLAFGRVLDLLGGLAIFGVYVGLLFAGIWSSGTWRQVIEEHFPGIALPPVD